MTLLLKTDIETRIHRHIHGQVARVGGTVPQMMNYRGSIHVTDINVIDGGFGYVKRIRDIKSLRNALGTIRRYLRQEFKRLVHGKSVPLDRKTVILDIHDATQRPDLAHRFDACITSNVVEHSPNPLFFLLNCYYITKIGGYQYHAIPHYKYTYDMYRSPTLFEHFIEDFEKKTPLTDTTHVQDYTDSAIIKHGWQKKFHTAYPVAYPFMHHHVYDEFNTREMAEYMFEEVTNDIYKTPQHSDNVLIFKNVLNKRFVEQHRNLINSYSKTFLQKHDHS